MTPLEKDIEKALGRKVGKRGGLCLKWVCPGWAGVPDRIVLMPGGQIAFVELKRPKGGTLAARQKYWGRKLLEMGFEYWQVWTFEELKLFEEVVLDE